MDIYHLYHGSRVNRQYAERHKMLDVEDDIRKMTFKNEDGVLEWKDAQIWNPLFSNYFQQRHDDDLSLEVKGEEKKEMPKATKTS